MHDNVGKSIVGCGCDLGRRHEVAPPDQHPFELTDIWVQIVPEAFHLGPIPEAVTASNLVELFPCTISEAFYDDKTGPRLYHDRDNVLASRYADRLAFSRPHATIELHLAARLDVAALPVASDGLTLRACDDRLDEAGTERISDHDQINALCIALPSSRPFD
jgi:hypothetical protein